MDGDELDRAMRALAERQHSVVSGAQVRSLGANGDAVVHRRASLEWERATPRVLRLVGSVATFEQRCMIAVLDAGGGAVVSHETSLGLIGLPGFDAVALHVSRQRGRAARQVTAATLHQPRLLPERHLTEVRGIPTVCPARALFDAASTLHPGRVERALDNALARKLVGLDDVRRVTLELLAHGRTGSALFRTLLATRGAGWIPKESSHERRLFALLAAAGDPLPDGQVDLGDERGWICRADAYYRVERLDVEVDGDLGHTAVLDVLADRRRDARLRATGIEVLRFTEHELDADPEGCLAEIRAVRRARRAA